MFKTKETIEPFDVTFRRPEETRIHGGCPVVESLQEFFDAGMILANASQQGYYVAWVWVPDALNPGVYGWQAGFVFYRDGYVSRGRCGLAWE